MAKSTVLVLFVATAEIENDLREVIDTYFDGDVIELSEDSFNFWASQGKCVAAPEGAKPMRASESASAESSPAAVKAGAPKAAPEAKPDDDAAKDTKPGAGSKPSGQKTDNSGKR